MRVLGDLVPFEAYLTPMPCCDFMRMQLDYVCAQHVYPCPDVLVVKSETGTLFLRAENAEYILLFCPWCGKPVREPIRDEE